jgi:hypothetical protein
MAAISAVTEATKLLQPELDKASQQATEEAKPVAVQQSVSIRTLLPMLGSVLLMLGTI